jgi:hypothetical protein
MKFVHWVEIYTADIVKLGLAHMRKAKIFTVVIVCRIGQNKMADGASEKR